MHALRRKEKGKASAVSMVQVLSIDELEISIDEDEHVSVDDKGLGIKNGNGVQSLLEGDNC